MALFSLGSKHIKVALEAQIIKTKYLLRLVNLIIFVCVMGAVY